MPLPPLCLLERSSLGLCLRRASNGAQPLTDLAPRQFVAPTLTLTFSALVPSPTRLLVRSYVGSIDHSWPHAPREQVPGDLLWKLGFWVPLASVLIISALRRSIHEAHHAALALVGAMAIMRITVDWIKNRVGRLRPDFWARCEIFDEIANTCSGDAWLVKDGRRSFPSGHSSTAFAGCFFLCLFLAGKNGGFAFSATFSRSSVLQSRLLRFSLAVSPLFLAAWIAITRIEDNYHRTYAPSTSSPSGHALLTAVRNMFADLEDVIVGSTIGILSALATYLVYFPSPFDARQVAVMDKAKLVYGAEEEGVRLGQVALGGEAEEGLLSGDGQEEA